VLLSETSSKESIVFADKDSTIKWKGSIGFMKCSYTLSLLGLLILPVIAQAVSFRPTIETAAWEIDMSPFMCRMTQRIPSFGEGVFEQEAGENLVFRLSPSQRQQLTGSVRLVAEMPSWQPGRQPQAITELSVSQGQVLVQGDSAIRMLAALHNGLFPTFSAQQWFQTSEPVTVGISSVNFAPAYDDYLDYLTQLLPVNYRQIARTAVLFPPDQFRLSDATTERLDQIIQYVLTDPSVQQIFIDGHSDNVGRRLLNRDTSRRRAEAVTEYLVGRGVPEDIIIMRYHGDRYPVVDNDTEANRTRNRRVTIRLERE